ncbi:hypothetical protein KRX51_01465 [Corynebacterium sp. TAE3-ERU12]|uniref:hypothetical protein n=1 Tax=Corynebacterium sp. TAE3-ERU12 TaxID=2849491 RepID=UPI001C44DDC9|nr:hypothetical protein [Corynebacterium sp. TAE3-ERU12]MBV7294584.1 hypothetical protein [Corynebacterium sp. TAE3-ERU12]
MAEFGEPAQPESFSRFADADAGAGRSSAPLQVITGPWHWVSAAIVSAAIGVCLGAAAPMVATATDSLWAVLALTGWILAGVVTFVLVGVHTIADTQRQAAGPYLSTPAQEWLYRVAIVVGLAGVVLTAIEIAMWAAKTGVL